MRGVGAIGNMLQFARDPIGYVTKVFERFGPISLMVRAPTSISNPGPGWGSGQLRTAEGKGVVFVTGAEANREVLMAHDRYHMIALTGRLYPTEVDVSERRKPLLRTMTGLFHINGNEHRRGRRLLMPAFYKTRIEAYRDDMLTLTDEMLGRWKKGETRDVHGDMTELTLRIATKTLFGEDERERGVRLSHLMQAWLETMMSPFQLIPQGDWPGTPRRRFLDLTREIDRETATIVRNKRARASSDGKDMLSMLIAARDEDGSLLDEDELIGHAGTIFAAGHETSTNALAWTYLLLSQHPKVMHDLEDELDAVLRGAPPTIEDLAKLPLLDAVVKESLRILPPVPMHPRIVAEDHTLMGHFLPAGSELFISIFHMHRDPDVFPAPNVFSPKRWETSTPTVFEYNPFSAGPRMCIGASFATMEIKLVLATMMQRFRLELPARSRVDHRVAISMAPRGGLRMTIRDRHETVKQSRVSGKIRTLLKLPD